MAQFSHLGITTAKTVSNAQAVTNGVNAFSNAVEMKVWGGFAAIEVKANTATVTITQQCSVDGVTWYDPVDQTGTALGAIATALATTAYIEFSPVVTIWVRLKYAPTGSGSITVNLVVVE
jgi:hypothetical protein